MTETPTGAYVPLPGHRVRRTQITEGLVVDVEGKVVSFADHSLALLTDDAPEGGRRDLVTWERLPDPEPEWRPGDVAQDATGQVYVRRDPAAESGEHDRYVWWLGGVGGDWETDDRLVRPVVRLVPETPAASDDSPAQGEAGR